MEEFEFGAEVRVNLAGRVVGLSEFETGEPAYLVDYGRNGELRRQWVAAEILVRTSGDQIEQKGNSNV